MKRSMRKFVVCLVSASLLATVFAAAAPFTAETAAFKTAADTTYRSWADWHLNTLGSIVYDTYETVVDTYQVIGDLGWARGSYTIVTRSRCGGSPCTTTGVFQSMFEKLADGSWKISSHTMIPWSAEG